MSFTQSLFLVQPSKWPIFFSFVGLGMVSSFLFLFKMMNFIFVMLNLLMFIIMLWIWCRDVLREGFIMGVHTLEMLINMRIGMILFISSEVMFFFGFFWSFFHSALSPVYQLGNLWPVYSLIPVFTFGVPLLNTLVLLSSGISVTWSHHSILNLNMYKAKLSMMITISLGLYFTFLQVSEYYSSSFSLCDSVYGSVFFVATGFHGLHVLIGSSFLLVMLVRMFYMEFTNFHHIGFELAAWYWHFVDVVWIFLFSWLYWWSA